MSFKKRQYKLVWPEDHDLHGLEVFAKGMSFKKLEVITSMRGNLDGDKISDASIQSLKPMIEIFSESLISWNYEDDDGRPVGTSLAELMDEDFKVLLPIIVSWAESVSDISDPLVGNSSSGKQSQEELETTEQLLKSLESSSTQN